MIKKLFKKLLVVLSIGVVAFFFLAGKIADRLYNKVDELEDYEVSEAAKQLHRKLQIVDLHSDNLLWDRDPNTELSHGHVDIPRLLAGNYTIQVFDAVIKTPKGLNYVSNTDETDNVTTLAMGNRWPIKTWYSLLNRAIYQSKLLHRASVEGSNLTIIKSQSDLSYFLKLRASNSYLIGGLLSIEGLHALEGRLSNLDILYEHDYRMFGLVHFFDNEVGGSSSGVNKGGLTDFGKQVIRSMEQKSIIIDLAHASEALFSDVLDMATRPVVVSHTGVKGLYDSPRNLSDNQIRQIAENGGLIGIGFWHGATGDIHPSAIARAIRYAVDIAGISHVALGSDFDGAVKTTFDSSQIIFITEALIREGFTQDEIHLLMGGNALHFFQENLPS
jgi:membrane dipeptidase